MNYILKRFARQSNLQIVDECIRILEASNRKDKEFLLHLFLDEVFTKNKELSKKNHSLQIPLYLKYDKSKLMHFLQNTEAYNPF